MSIQDPGFRPDQWKIAGDHERRIAKLEAQLPGGLTGIRFNYDNQGGYFDLTTNTGNIRFATATLLDFVVISGGAIGLDAALLVHLSAGGTSAPVFEMDASETSLRFLATGQKFVIRDVANSVVFEVDEDGTVFPSGGGGIAFDFLNTGTWFDLETTGDNGGAGIHLHDTASAAGMLIEAETGLTIADNDTGAGTGNGLALNAQLNVALASAGGIVSMTSTDGYLAVGGTGMAPQGVEMGLPASGSMAVLDSVGSPILQTDEATGVTTGVFDGGSP